MHLQKCSFKIEIYASAIITQWITDEFSDAPYKACMYVHHTKDY